MRSVGEGIRGSGGCVIGAAYRRRGSDLPPSIRRPVCFLQSTLTRWVTSCLLLSFQPFSRLSPPPPWAAPSCPLAVGCISNTPSQPAVSAAGLPLRLDSCCIFSFSLIFVAQVRFLCVFVSDAYFCAAPSVPCDLLPLDSTFIADFCLSKTANVSLNPDSCCNCRNNMCLTAHPTGISQTVLSNQMISQGHG